MNKIITFSVAILLILVADLLHFEAPPSASQDTHGSAATEALAEFSGDAVNSNSGFGFKQEFNSPISDDTSSVSPGKVFDPVTMLLLGSGLIGLAGLGRKKV
ncbi:hypothetical protein [Desulfosarcina sp.]|uniref:hypothetical protein n=1 Tax=Desulfosarcina sp. TaxID=2027861 RepID=UPI003565C898